MPVSLQKLVDLANQWLMPVPVSDYCPNGLQVEGKAHVKKIVSGVTASQALLEAAIAAGADLVLVHHGYFWKNEPAVVTGIKKRRLQTLLNHDVSLLAYHLPLDLHEELGNNVQLGQQLGIQIKPAGPASGLVRIGELGSPMSGEEFATLLEQRLSRAPLHITGGPSRIRTVAWCTGAAQGYIDKALEMHADAYISGEISEATVHSAREGGIHYFAAGHHATERYGVQALGRRLAEALDIEHEFIDIDNPA